LRLKGSWFEARDFCGKLGMSPITVQNEDKENCLADVFSK